MSDLAMITATAQALLPAGPVAELRILHTPRHGTVSGYFDDHEALARAAASWSGKAPAVYVTLNPCNPALLARAANRLKERVNVTTTDHDIVRRAWLPCDFDPVRPAGISSTDAEHAAALARAEACRAWLTARGWPPPVTADSGNGGHLLYAIDLPNTEGSRQLVQHCLEALALYFTDDGVALDVSVFNAARIWKLYGTLACKGDNLPERPHRLSRLLTVPQPLECVTQEQLAALAALLPPQPHAQAPRSPQAGQGFNLAQWITAHPLSVVREGPWQQSGHRWVLNPCPWNPDHTDNSAFIVQHASGAIAAGCHHNGCQGKDWQALRARYEPGWQPPSNGVHGPEEGIPTYDNPQFPPWELGQSQGLDTGENDPQPITTLPTYPQEKTVPWPTMQPEAYYGLAGDFVRMIAPQSESDKAALLIQLLATYGVAVGRTRFYLVEATPHYPNIYAVIVGKTARARKGTSYAHIDTQVRAADPTWTPGNHLKGVGSGEGLIFAVRDARVVREAIRDKNKIITDYQDNVVDEGVRDKRALFQTGEFSSVLKVAGRDGNTLSEVLRDAWDTGYLRNATKQTPLVATDAHIGIIGHITVEEVRQILTSVDMANGFGNRFIWVCAKRSQELPDGGDFSSTDFSLLRTELKKALHFGKQPGRLTRTPEAREAWHAVYGLLSEDRTGLANTLLARAEAQVLRLSMLYALLDCSEVITLAHQNAALALWEYAEDSAAYIFGEATGDPTADTILDALANAGDKGCTKNDLVQVVFQRNTPAHEVDRALAVLEHQNRVMRTTHASGKRGRPAEVFRLTHLSQGYVVNVGNSRRYLLTSNDAAKHASIPTVENTAPGRGNCDAAAPPAEVGFSQGIVSLTVTDSGDGAPSFHTLTATEMYCATCGGPRLVTLSLEPGGATGVFLCVGCDAAVGTWQGQRDGRETAPDAPAASAADDPLPAGSDAVADEAPVAEEREEGIL